MTDSVCDFCDKEIDGTPVTLRIVQGEDYNDKGELREEPTISYVFHRECAIQWAPEAHKHGHIGRYQMVDIARQCEALHPTPKKRGRKMTCVRCEKETDASSSKLIIETGRRVRFCYTCLRLAAR